MPKIVLSDKLRRELSVRADARRFAAAVRERAGEPLTVPPALLLRQNKRDRRDFETWLSALGLERVPITTGPDAWRSK